MIFIVATGERGEGQVPLHAATSLPLARMLAAKAFGPLDFQKQGTEYGRWMATRNDVDEVWIYRMKLRAEL